MVFYSSLTAAEADLHRQDLLADARRFRLAKLARAARRAARTAARHADPPLVPSVARDARPERKDDADRRYAVSR